MVTKLTWDNVFVTAEFESCVVLDGDKTRPAAHELHLWFESCVVLEGDKTA